MKWRLPWGRKSAITSSLELFNEIYGSKASKSGVAVDWQTAIRVATVLACTRVLSQGLAQVPLKVFRDDRGTKAPRPDHPLYYLLHTAPNSWMTAYEYRALIGVHLTLAGRHFSFINRSPLTGDVAELIPFEPGQVEVDRDKETGVLTYTVTLDNGRRREFPAEAVWHLRGLSWSGWQALDAVGLAREAIGLSIAAEEQHSMLFQNGVSASGVYSVEGKLTKEQYRDLREFLKENHTGQSRGLPMIVDRGAKWLQKSLSGIDAQHYEVRRHQVEEVCRALGVLPIMIGHSDKSVTYASAEQMFLAHVTHTMMPLYVNVEQSVDANLIGKASVKRGFYSRHIVAGLLRGAMRDRGEYYARALGSGGGKPWMTQDEVRALEEMNPRGGEADELSFPGAVSEPDAEGSDDDGSDSGSVS